MEENKLTVREACLKVLEFTYEDLGRAMAVSWKLPAAVGSAMNSATLSNFSRQCDEEKINTLVAFSHDLTYWVYRRDPQDNNKNFEILMQKYSSIPNLDREAIQEVLNEAVTRTKQTFDMAGVPFDDLQLHRQYEIVLSDIGQLEEPHGTALTAVADQTMPMREAPESERAGADEDLLAQLVSEVHTAIEPGNEPKLNEILMMALEACHRGAGFERVVFCLATPDRMSLRGRLGLGPAIDTVIEALNIPLQGHSESLTVPILLKKDLFVDTALDEGYLDSRLAAKLGATCFGLYPVVVDNVVVGCLYFDKVTSRTLPAPKVLETLAGLRNALADLIRRTRAHA
jgi:hypothetical protein